jgi:hypothetical protein
MTVSSIQCFYDNSVVSRTVGLSLGSDASNLILKLEKKSLLHAALTNHLRLFLVYYL